MDGLDYEELFRQLAPDSVNRPFHLFPSESWLTLFGSLPPGSHTDWCVLEFSLMVFNIRIVFSWSETFLLGTWVNHFENNDWSMKSSSLISDLVMR
jgi:hypothetical protein